MQCKPQVLHPFSLQRDHQGKLTPADSAPPPPAPTPTPASSIPRPPAPAAAPPPAKPSSSPGELAPRSPPRVSNGDLECPAAVSAHASCSPPPPPPPPPPPLRDGECAGADVPETSVQSEEGRGKAVNTRASVTKRRGSEEDDEEEEEEEEKGETLEKVAEVTLRRKPAGKEEPGSTRGGWSLQLPLSSKLRRLPLLTSRISPTSPPLTTVPAFPPSCTASVLPTPGPAPGPAHTLTTPPRTRALRQPSAPRDPDSTIATAAPGARVRAGSLRFPKPKSH
ncbi:hypothetical protein CRUP_024951 [Coryphaenoides rupestris]|nr:hypothetical protein CRUP_024951 [Coryphaenoides rupestris]